MRTQQEIEGDLDRANADWSRGVAGSRERARVLEVELAEATAAVPPSATKEPATKKAKKKAAKKTAAKRK